MGAYLCREIDSTSEDLNGPIQHRILFQHPLELPAYDISQGHPRPYSHNQVTADTLG